MPTRRTSRKALEYLVTTGLLGKRQMQSYRILFAYGPLTAQELARHVPSGWKRLPELRSMGLVDEVGERRCTVTSRTVILWDVTDRMPNTDAPTPALKQKGLFDA